MFLMGDEVRRTQLGNNKAYRQDNEGTWFDWSLVKKRADVRRFVELLIARRLLRHTNAERQRMILTHLISGGFKDWVSSWINRAGATGRITAFSAELAKEDMLTFAIFNAYC
jgi:isoamylase